MPPTESPASPILSTTTNTPHQYLKSKTIIITVSMAAIISLSILCLILFFTISSASHRHHPTDNDDDNNIIISQVCRASRDPPSCRSSLSRSNRVPPRASVSQAIESALSVSTQNLITGVRMVNDILDASAGDRNRSDAARTCLEVLRYADYRTNSSRDALRRGGGLKDARAWTSAALGYQYGCCSGLRNLNDATVANAVDFFNSSLMASTSDALGMMLNHDAFGDETASWAPPRTERDGFWEPVLHDPGISTSIGVRIMSGETNVTVCKREVGPCDYETVQGAVDAAPDNAVSERFVIWIKSGVYEETVRVPLEKRNVVFLGDGMGKTVITGSMNVGQQGVSTYNSATVGVLGDGFMARGITIQNAAGPDAHQAVAFRSDSDLSVIESCEFIGNQDTLYAHSLRQYYKSCRIQGNIDFIFGNSAAFFQDCLILVAPRQVEPEKGENNAVTAHGRVDPAQSTGFVFQNCVINGTDEYMRLYYAKPNVHKNFLGRPWKEYSRTVFINSTMEALITPDGWMPWSGDFALNTLYYGELDNSGPGSNLSKRVGWSSRIPVEHAYSYSIQNFIQGDQWVPTSS